ncbi:MAG: hypothetical protein BWY69_01050 [Planctomycetes bacterium ADurb.Bin401]|nr:MAG: hypothetical protein BWY69_01050 [Planctomycetes bacterium ADurb.Bin401]
MKNLTALFLLLASMDCICLINDSLPANEDREVYINSLTTSEESNISGRKNTNVFFIKLRKR